MTGQRPRRFSRHRLPLTITLDPAMLAFVDKCAHDGHYRSLDDFFDAALNIFRRHIEALDAYMELEGAKGHSVEEILAAAECEIVFTRKRGG